MPLPDCRVTQAANVLASVVPVTAVCRVLNDVAFFTFELHVPSKLGLAYYLNLELTIRFARRVIRLAQN